MPHQIGFVDDSTVLAHYKLLEVVRDFVVLNGWTVLRYDDVSSNRELIVKAPGLTGTEEIFLGLRTYQNVSADYYISLLQALADTYQGTASIHNPLRCCQVCRPITSILTTG